MKDMVDNIVAHSTLMPSANTNTYHGVMLGIDNARVRVDKVTDPFVSLPMPSFNTIDVGQTERAFVPWPKYLIIVSLRGDVC